MKKNLLIPVCSWIVLVIVVILIVVNVVIPENRYSDAAALMESGDYAKAAEAFTALGDYKDSAQKAASAKLEADYQAAEALMESGDYTGAAEAFTALADYKDSAQKAASAKLEVDYQAAQDLLDQEDYAKAQEAFTALGDYKDSAQKAASAKKELDYQAAQDLLDQEDYAKAQEAFTALGEFKDSKDQAAKAQNELDRQIAQQNLESYNTASALADTGSYSDAHKIFDELGDYNDSPQKSEEMRTARFNEGMELLYEEKFEEAYDVFKEVSEWTCHEDYALVEEKEPAYYAALTLFYRNQFEDAHDAFSDLGDYSDSQIMAQNCLDEPGYRNAVELYEEGKYEDAKKIFDELDGYKDSDSYARSCKEHLTYISLVDRLEDAYELDEGSDEYKNELKSIFDAFLDLQGLSDSQEKAYQIAGKLFDLEEYETCAQMYSDLGDYADSAEKLENVLNIIAYREAKETLDLAQAQKEETKKEELYEEALEAFIVLGDYSDSRDQVYAIADRYVQKEDFENAIYAFSMLEGYLDSEERIQEILNEVSYREAVSLMKDGAYEAAIEAFEELDGYKDSAEQIKACEEAIKDREYDAAAALMEDGEYESAIMAFEALDGYKDSAGQIKACEEAIKDREYDAAAALMEDGEYESAIMVFEELDGYKDSAAQIEACMNEIKAAAGLDVKGALTYEEYADAGPYTPVTIEAYVQGKQAWSPNNIETGTDTVTIYAQDEDGGYFLYNIPCSRADYYRLREGTRIRCAGYKREWAGEVEVAGDDLTPIEILGGRSWIAEPVDVTDLMEDEDEISGYMNQKVAFTALTVASPDAVVYGESEETGAEGDETPAFWYGWDGSGQEGDDLYFFAKKDGELYEFAVESSLCDKDSDVYKAVQELKPGDQIDLEGFLYWYEGMLPHITKVVSY